MQRHRLADEAAGAAGAEEVGLRLDCRRARPGRQVQPGGVAANLVGKGHVGAAMDDAARVHVPVVGVDLANDLAFIGGDDADAEMPRHAARRIGNLRPRTAH